MQKDEVELLRQAVEQQTIFLGNLLDTLVMTKQLDRQLAKAFVGSVEELTEHPAVKARWASVKERL